MTQTSWDVHAFQKPMVMQMDAEGLTFTSPAGAADSGRQIRWDQVASLSFPNAAGARLTHKDGALTSIGFANRDAMQAFGAAYRDLTAPMGDSAPSAPPAPAVSRPAVAATLLVTTDTIPGRRIVRPVGLVSAQVVMSRNAFSDFGSNIKSTFGGNLEGIERAMADAVQQAKHRLALQARELRADAVVGVQFSIASVADKAEAVLMAGTAVLTDPDPAGSAG